MAPRRRDHRVDDAGYPGLTHLCADREPGAPYEPSSYAYHLAVSSDGLRTWQNIQPPAAAANQVIHQFWLDPVTQRLIVMSEPPGWGPPLLQKELLWVSGDGGKTWTTEPSPQMNAPVTFVASPDLHTFCDDQNPNGVVPLPTPDGPVPTPAANDYYGELITEQLFCSKDYG